MNRTESYTLPSGHQDSIKLFVCGRPILGPSAFPVSIGMHFGIHVPFLFKVTKFCLPGILATTCRWRQSTSGQRPITFDLRASCASLPVLFERMYVANRRVFSTTKLLVPLLFFLGQSCLKGARLTSVEVKRRDLEECDILRNQNVLNR